MSDGQRQVTIIGGGLVGSLCACFMAKRNWAVTLYEKRRDIRKIGADPGKSINLALSNRARKALRKVGLEEIVLKYAIPMKGRLVHDLSGKTHFLQYDTLTKQCIYSISRNTLNQILLTAAENDFRVKIFFQHELIDANLKAGVACCKNLQTQEIIRRSCTLIIGADGAHSSLRSVIQQRHLFTFSQNYIDVGYVELNINPEQGKLMRPNCLHIWPRGTYMMVALPNLDASWTVTLFMPFSKFDEIKNTNSFLEFFQKDFPDAVGLLGVEQINQDLACKQPRSLVSIFCNPYHFYDKVVLIGDAAHAMVPFYGQGMNAGFEDCLILNDILETNKDNVAKAIEEYSSTRKKDADAICELAMYNYREMSNFVNRKSYRFRKIVDEFLYSLIPQLWIPLYISVTFSDMNYKQCIDNKKWQDKVIRNTLILITVFGLIISLIFYTNITKNIYYEV